MHSERDSSAQKSTIDSLRAEIQYNRKIRRQDAWGEKGKVLSSVVLQKVEKIFFEIGNGNLEVARTELKTSNLDKIFDADLLAAIEEGLGTGNWLQLKPLFLNTKFITQDGLIFWVAPYRQFRNGTRFEKVTGILGVAPIRNSYSQIRETAEQHFGGNFHAISEIIGFRRISCVGIAGGKEGEAFLVPNGWLIGDVSEGVALNDMTEQYARIRASETTVRRILSRNSADLVLSAVMDTIKGASLQNLEFQFHEVAHGIGL
ncbi:MAG: hypothetical protein CMK06_09260, partial [Ponticaulis sp.]|nr:hypothetical protein [Ponticaulis sp.]